MSAAPNKPLWHIVPLAEFALPPTPVQEVATKRMHALRRLFRSESAPQPPAMALEDLRNLPEARLAHLAPPIDWRRAADALTIQFAEWAKADDAAKMPRFLVGPPYGGHAEVLEFWAASHGWHLIAPLPANTFWPTIQLGLKMPTCRGTHGYCRIWSIVSCAMATVSC